MCDSILSNTVYIDIVDDGASAYLSQSFKRELDVGIQWHSEDFLKSILMVFLYNIVFQEKEV